MTRRVDQVTNDPYLWFKVICKETKINSYQQQMCEKLENSHNFN